MKFGHVGRTAVKSIAMTSHTEKANASRTGLTSFRKVDKNGSQLSPRSVVLSLSILSEQLGGHERDQAISPACSEDAVSSGEWRRKGDMNCMIHHRQLVSKNHQCVKLFAEELLETRNPSSRLSRSIRSHAGCCRRLSFLFQRLCHTVYTCGLFRVSRVFREDPSTL